MEGKLEELRVWGGLKTDKPIEKKKYIEKAF